MKYTIIVRKLHKREWHFNKLPKLTYNLRDALTSQAGFAFQSMKIQYTGMPDRIMITPTPTSHGET